jgi:mono/diheme cytochrome c family protein
VGPEVAPNITPDVETGAGSWTDDMFVRAIREGFGHDGRPLLATMRSEYYGILTDEDVASVVVYLRSLPPVRHELPKVIWPEGQRGHREGPISTPASPDELLDSLGLGKYLVRYATCEHCHTPHDSVGNSLPGLRFAGGTICIEDSTRVIASKNLTQDPSGIPYYDEALFIQAIRTGRVGGVRELNPWMEWPYFRIMTDNDLKAIFGYLRTQPPVRHSVDNTEPPRPCRLCGRTHGLGDLN